MNNISAKQILSYIVKAIKPFPLPIFTMFLAGVIWAVDLSLRAYLLKVILNRLASSEQHNIFVNLIVPIIFYLGLYLLLSISFRVYNYFVEIKMIPALRAKIANDALELLVDKSQNFYQNNFSGSLTNKVNDLTSSVPAIVRIVIDRFFSHGLALCIAIITLWQVSIHFALGMLVWTVILITGAWIYSKHISMLAAKWSESASTITGNLVDVLSNILSVRLFSAKSQEKKSLGSVFQNAVNAERQLEWAYLWMWVCISVSSLVLQSFNFYFLLKGREEGWITVGDFAIVLLINISIADFFWELTKDFSEFSKLLGRITQALKIVLDKPEFQDLPGAYELKVTKGIIFFDQVLFHYKGIVPLFHNKSVIIEAGQKVGLVGYSGSGKSTFVNLILRLYDVTDGRILIDGQDIRECTQDSLRKNIAMIPQDPSLFHRTLIENIRYGRIEASDQSVVEAAKKAHAHDFITKLPQGYKALVGERGVKLSGGQRQRIAIARAILKNAPILILDEATSALDSVVESDIQQSLWELMQGKTTIVIAHRLSTLLQMDRILVFDMGKIVEDGTHTELLSMNGLYKTLWEAQIGGFLLDQKI
jgi:ATP-binding cassette subfamily B protein